MNSTSEATVLDSDIVYVLEPIAPVQDIQVAVEVLEGPVAAKGYLLAVEAFDGDSERIGSQHLLWPYSTQLDTSYAYIPATDDGYAEVPRLKSQSPVTSLRFRVVPWSGPKSASPRQEVFGRLVYRYWTVADAEGAGATSSVAGVAKLRVGSA